MYGHLFDYDNIYINKLEAIIDRFSELCGIGQTDFEKVRNRLINIISLDTTVNLVKKLPQDQQSILKILLKDPTVEEVNRLKGNFQPSDILNEFHSSAKRILTDKFNGIKDKIPTYKHYEFENLLQLIGKY